MVKGFIMFPAGRKWSPDFSQIVNPREMIHGIVEPGHGTNLMVTTWSAQSANIETYRGEIKQKYGSNFKVPVVY
jgi:hypothetical protein